MNAVKQLTQPGHSPEFVELRITALAEEGFHLSDGGVAKQAVSCLVRPEVGDRVLVAQGQDERYVLHILAREAGGRAQLSVPGAAEMELVQRRLSLLAQEHLAMQSLADLDLTALGCLKQSANDQFVHVARALIETLNQHVSRAQTRSWDSDGLLAMSAGQVLCHAEGDYRLDAERISLG
jgi:hypothetical protein